MSSSDPLGSLFFRYRKRKQISVDGRTPGLEYQRRHRGLTQTPLTGHAAQQNRDEYEALNNVEQYQPGRRFYSLGGPEYEMPESWHDTRFAQTPPIGHSALPPPVFRPEPVHRDEPEGPQPADAIDIKSLFDPNRTVRLTIGEIHAHMNAQREYAESVYAGQLMDAIRGGHLGRPSPLEVFSSALTDAALNLKQAAEAMDALEPATVDGFESELLSAEAEFEPPELDPDFWDQAAEAAVGRRRSPRRLDWTG